MPLEPSRKPDDASPAWNSHAGRIVGIYAVFAALWILVSDRILFFVIPECENIKWLNTAKGLFFVAVTSVLLWFMLRRLLAGLGRSQAELSEREHQVSTIYNAVNDGIVVVDMETGAVIGANRTACHMFDYPQDEIRGMTVADISSGEAPYTKERALELIRSAASGEKVSSEWRCQRSDGSRFWAEVVGLVTTLDRTPRFLATVRDVTARHKAENEIRESRARLRALLARLQEIREAERGRISREVHDVLGQLLTGIKMNLNWLGRRISPLKEESAGPELIAKLEETEALADSVIESVREISHDLRPGILDDLGLPAAIRFEAGRFEQRTGVSTSVDIAAEPVSISAARATQVFRVFQELLTNVARHAEAGEVTVRLDRDGGDLVLRVVDNGRGISDEEVSAAGSLGLMGMAERASLLDGDLRVRRGETRGTIAILTFPEADG